MSNNDHKNSIKLLSSIFLICPECDDKGFIDKIEKDHFIVKCKCAKWRIDFKITEV